MKKRISGILIAFSGLLYLIACNQAKSSKNNFIAADSITLAAGEASFHLNCSGCHTFSQDGIGPQLSGLTANVSVDWIRKFIRDPQQIISSGDERAQQLYTKYKTGMPAFGGLKEEEINNIIAFMYSKK
ncbi:MAG: c-type cytochrome [Chitinophagales bacterium]